MCKNVNHIILKYGLIVHVYLVFVLVVCVYMCEGAHLLQCVEVRDSSSVGPRLPV